MDPDAALEEILTLLPGILAGNATGIGRFAELVEGLHNWISGGGFLPAKWRR